MQVLDPSKQTRQYPPNAALKGFYILLLHSYPNRSLVPPIHRLRIHHEGMDVTIHIFMALLSLDVPMIGTAVAGEIRLDHIVNRFLDQAIVSGEESAQYKIHQYRN